MADNLVYEESLNNEIDQSEFIQKRWVYVNDNNSQNYTSQIVIDSTPLSNAGGWINWSEGYIVMPLVVQLTTDSLANKTKLPANTNIADYSWAFKNGFWNIINSMTVEFNNQNIIQQTPFLNVFRSFKAHTSWSQDDLLNEGMSSGYYPDNAGSWSFSNNYEDDAENTALSDGVNCGISNNKSLSFYASRTTTSTAINPVASTIIPNLPFSGFAGDPILTTAGGVNTVRYSGTGNPSTLSQNCYSVNDGMRKRQEWNGYDPASSNGQGILNGADKCSVVYRSHKLTSVEGTVSWSIFAKLRLKDLADFFEKTPLLKGSTIRFYINTNQTAINFTVANGTITNATGEIATQPYILANQVNTIGGLSNPLMLSSVAFGQGGSALPTGTYNLSVSIFKNNFSSQISVYPGAQSALNSCRLYAPVYTMNPLAESKYLSLAPTKRIRYKDVFQYQFNNQQMGSFNFLVSNGISNIVSVLVVPFISKATTIKNNAGAIVQVPFSSQQNPFSTSPATPDPIMITNFNILISGVNLFLNNELYDFEAFRQQLLQSNQLNGSLTTGLASGLISEDMFSRGYRYYYGDCSRVLPSEEGVSRSVQIVGQTASAYPAYAAGIDNGVLSVDFMVFVEFMREIVIDVSTGARLE